MTTEPFRLPEGGLIDRSQRLSFTFNRRAYQGYAGDTLASALLANGVRLTARSFKYHRPRGIIGAGFEEAASLVQLMDSEDAPNMPITRVALYDGLSARTVNCWPSPAFDLGAINQVFARLIPAAFYYKTFKWPDWRHFEPMIRRAAGLGRAPEADPVSLQYETRWQHCDVLVVGAGPAGLMAALAAGRSGARVLLVDDDLMPGGRLLSDGGKIGAVPALVWVRGVIDELDRMENVERLSNACAWAYREHNLVLVTERRPAPTHLFQRTRRVRARQVILATGAIERPLVFAGNDRPGVMLASAVRSYIHRHAVSPGSRAVMFTNNDSAYESAFNLAAAGVAVAAIVDARDGLAPALAERVRRSGLPLRTGHVITDVAGRRRVRAVLVEARAGGGAERIACDLVCLSGGWDPAVHLFSQSRGSVQYDEALASFRPGVAAQNSVCVGSCNARFDLGDCLDEGARAGAAAAKAAGFTPVRIDAPPAEPVRTYGIEPLWPACPGTPGAKAFVDIQNDVTVEDVHLAMREGFGAVEHLKRYTTAGMGVDQGKTGNVNVIGLIAQSVGVPPSRVGTTTFRPPFLPIEFGAIAGHRTGPLLLPYRHTPMTPWHLAHGAVMYEAGGRWRRPGYYPLPGESFSQSVEREARAVRAAAGIYDGSPLGKFEIVGPDAVKLLNFVYTNAWGDLGERHGRYGIMLSDDGLIFDDGVTFKLADGHYLMTTSTANAERVHQKLEELLQIERPDWQVKVTPVTAQWANATVCGPLARDVLRAAGTDLDLGAAAFPFMAMREGRVADLPVRVCRVSFTGELSFEVNVAARHGLALWSTLMAAGAAYGIAPVGSEANHVLRVEKGFLSLGHEADGTADPIDLGMGWILSKAKSDFLGKRSVAIRRGAGSPRRELVGLLFPDPQAVVPEGSPITPGGRREATEGFVTACVSSVALGRTIALALLVNGRARIGDEATIRLKDRTVRAEITKPIFYDPDGSRMRS